MPVIDIARTSVVTLGPEASVAEVGETMRDEAVGGVVVVEDERPVGYVTDRDLAMAVLDSAVDAEETSVSEFLDPDPVTVEASAGVYELVERFSEEGVRQAPVVEDGTLAGIVSLSDVVVLLGMELQHLATAIRVSSPAYEQPGPDYYDQ